MISCKHAAELMSEEMDHPLPFWRKWALRIHVSMCVGCQIYRRQIRAIENLLKQGFSSAESAGTAREALRSFTLSTEKRQELERLIAEAEA
jgi:hypothetical protein